MEKVDIMISRSFGRRQYDYDKIEKLLTDDPYLRKCWADNCGVHEDDGRVIHGWPELFEKFYDGYYCGRY